MTDRRMRRKVGVAKRQPEYITIIEWSQRRGKGSIVHDKWLLLQVWSKVLLIHLEFSQFFVAHSSH
jgi:hypothetical protein